MAKRRRRNLLKNPPSIRKKRRAGAPPGSLVYTGTREGKDVTVHLVEYDPAHVSHQQLQNELPHRSRKIPVAWYDFRGIQQIPLIEEIGRLHHIHPLVLEDILDTKQRPKFEEYPDGLFLMMRAFRFSPDEEVLQAEQVGIFVTEGVVISFQEDEHDLFEPVRQRLEAGRGKIRQRGADYLAYALVDTVVDYYFNTFDELEEIFSEMEANILRNPQATSKGRIHEWKLQTLALRRSLAPLREAVYRFAQSEHDLVKEETKLFVRDLQDHTMQVLESVETYRDVLDGLYDLYVSEISFKTNNVVQVLTVISTIFIPLTFLVGVYGMNFHYMPELNARYGYFWLWGIMISITIALIFYFRRKRWL